MFAIVTYDIPSAYTYSKETQIIKKYNYSNREIVLNMIRSGEVMLWLVGGGYL